MNSIPGWELINISDICEAIIDCVNRTAPTVDYTTPYKMIRTTNIKRGRINTNDVKYVTEETYRRWSRRGELLHKDVVLTREAPLGEVGMMREQDTIFMGQRLVMYRANRELLVPEFLLYAMQERFIQGQIRAFGSGSTVEHMRVPDAKSIQVLLPPLEIQQKIANILSAYDDLIDNNQQRIKLLEQAACDLYQEWFVHFRFPGHEQVEIVDNELGLVPRNWQLGKMRDFLELKYGKSLVSSNRVDGEIPVYGSSGIIGLHNESLVEGPGIIVGRKGNVGSVFWSQRSFFPIDTVFYVSTKVDLYYVYYNLRERNFLNSDAAVPGLNRDYAHFLPFLLPTKDLLQKFSSIVAPIFSSIYLLEQKNKKLELTRDLLLPRLISGELDVSNLNIPVSEELAENEYGV